MESEGKQTAADDAECYSTVPEIAGEPIAKLSSAGYHLWRKPWRNALTKVCRELPAFRARNFVLRVLSVSASRSIFPYAYR